MTLKDDDDDHFFDDDLFDNDLFDDSDDVVHQSRSPGSGSASVEDDENLFNALVSDQKGSAPSPGRLSNNFEEDRTEVIMDDDVTLPNTYFTDDNGKVYNVRRSPFLIGRSKECDLVIRAKGVSRRHAELIYGEGRFTIRDLDSLNGTKVNGVPQPITRLNDADVIKLGRQRLSFFTDTNRGHGVARPPTTRSIHIPNRATARPVAPAPVPVQIPSDQGHSTDLLVKINFAVVVIIIMVTLGYVIWDELTPDDSFLAQQQQGAVMPPLGDGEIMRQDPSDWTKTGALPPIAQQLDEEINRLAAQVEAEIRGEDEKELPGLSSEDEELDRATRDIKAAQVRQKALDEARSAEQAQEALEQRSIAETSEAQSLLNTIMRSYISGDQFSGNLARMKVLSESEVINRRMRRDLINLHEIYSNQQDLYDQGEAFFKNNEPEKAFNVWGELVSREKQLIGDELSYYSRKISDRAVETTRTRAEAAEANGDLGEAIKLYQTLSQLRPQAAFKAKIDQMLSEAESRFDEADRILSQDPVKAVELLQSVMAATPRDHPLYIRAEAKLVWLKEGMQ